ncbi:MAG: hypothetical protein HC899_24275 [Leptolyngbyaceae cyanobacterium SM1_4_3]|nr:hypothetical protein [Leptolyngbyaceae cyanobacterium SM1_4_3]
MSKGRSAAGQHPSVTDRPLLFHPSEPPPAGGMMPKMNVRTLCKQYAAGKPDVAS